MTTTAAREDVTGRQRPDVGWLNPAFAKNLARREAATQGGFFLPYLRPGMSVIDCGCGPGSITVGLAEAVAPGAAVGIDVTSGHIERARGHAAERSVSNVRFEVADIHSLPFPDESFDAAFAHTVLQHVSDPVKALGEVRRVLKPGGVIGLREEDWGSWILFPLSQPLEDYIAYRNTGPWKGATFARRHRQVLHDAGFVRAQAGASVQCLGGADVIKAKGDAVARYILESFGSGGATSETSVASPSDATKATWAAAWRAWGEDPGAFEALLWCETVAWKE